VDKHFGRRRVLFLGASPKDAPPLRLDEEIREIDDALKQSRRRGRFRLYQRHAVTAPDVLQSLLDIGPQIVHFSGHGALKGLILMGTDGHSRLVEPEALTDLFEAFAKEVECVVLNTCYSAPQAEGISAHIDYVIGVSDKVTDSGAIGFAQAFYRALGAGRTVEQAYTVGCAATPLLGGKPVDRPVLRIHPRLSKEGAIEEPPRKRWTLTLKANLDDLDKGQIEAIVEQLRQITQDSSITLKEVARGSVVMQMEGSEDAFQVIRYLFAEGDLSSVEGIDLIEFASGWGRTNALSEELYELMARSSKPGKAIQDLAIVLKRYLGGIGYLEPVTLGGDDDRDPLATTDANRQLSEALTAQAEANHRSAKAILVAFVLIGTAAIAAPFALSGRLALFAAFMAAVLLSFVFALRKLRGLWADNNTIRVCLQLLRVLPPEAAGELINLLYWTVVKAR